MGRAAHALAWGFTVVVAISSVEGAATRAPSLPFIENDFEKALASAKESGKPLFVEVWAPW